MKASIMGYGRTGRGIAKLLKEKEYDIFISDINPETKIEMDVEYETGRHSDEVLNSSIVVISPGINPEIDIIRRAKSKGIPVYSEIEVASWFIKGTMIAITGTNGKTTTAGMLKSILDISKRETFLAGNIYPGIPLSEIASSTTNNSFVIVEVSSFQLEHIDRFHPQIGIITNIGIDHCDRYKGMRDYTSAKMRLFQNFNENDIAVLNKDDIYIMGNLERIKGEKRFFSMKEKADIYKDKDEIRCNEDALFNKGDIYFGADVFVQDAMAAALAGIELNVSFSDIREGLRKFKGIPHRMENIGRYGGIEFINNSMCTNPDAFARTLKDFPHSVLIVGGRLKGIDPEQIIDAIIKYADGVVIIGESKKMLSEKLKENKYYNFVLANTMNEAVESAIGMFPKRVILHPGGASQDMYTDFTERGEVFKDVVRRHYEG